MANKKMISAIMMAALAISSASLFSGCVGGVYQSAPAPAPAPAAPAEEPAEESGEEPAEESSEAPAEESSEEPAEESSEEPAEESSEAPAEESSEEAVDGTLIKFTKPEKWGEDVNIYIFQKEDKKENAAWPGEAMTKNADGTYSYVFKSDEIQEPLVIFNDGKKQYPKSGGLELEDGKMYTVE